MGHNAVEVFLGYELAEEVLGQLLLRLLQGGLAEHTYIY
jgi:hypothetical protein